jgi:hypothetical protein
MILVLCSVKYRKERDLESLLRQTSAHPDCQMGTELIGTVCPRYKFAQERGGYREKGGGGAQRSYEQVSVLI